MLLNPRIPSHQNQWDEMRAAARALAVQIEPAYASAESEFDAIFATLAQIGAGALVISNYACINVQTERLARLSQQYAFPAIHIYREFVAARGLMMRSKQMVRSVA